MTMPAISFGHRASKIQAIMVIWSWLWLLRNPYFDIPMGIGKGWKKDEGKGGVRDRQGS